MAGISAVIITKNESENIARCIQAAAKAVEEVIVVDSMSKDDTAEIARQSGARVIQKEWLGYAQTKNFANGLAINNWILSIDADEVLSDELIESIKNIELQPSTVYALDRINNYCGQWIKHSGWYPDWKKRLFDRRHVYWVGDYVHEKIKHPSDFKIVELTGLLEHYSYKTQEEHWERIERYTQLAAEEMHAKGTKSYLTKIWISPLFRFFRTYVLKMGFLDGKNGYLISKRNAILVHKKYQKLRSLAQKKE